MKGIGRILSIVLSTAVAAGPAYSVEPWRIPQTETRPGAGGLGAAQREQVRERGADTQVRTATPREENAARQYSRGTPVQTTGALPVYHSPSNGNFVFSGTAGQMTPEFKNDLRAAFRDAANAGDRGAIKLMDAIGWNDGDTGNGNRVSVTFTVPTSASAGDRTIRGTVDGAVTLNNGGTFSINSVSDAPAAAGPAAEGGNLNGPPAPGAEARTSRDGGNTINNARDYARGTPVQTGTFPVYEKGARGDRPFVFSGTSNQMSPQMKSDLRAAFRGAAAAGDSGAIRLMNAIGWEEGSSGNNDRISLDFQVPTGGAGAADRGIDADRSHGSVVTLRNGASFDLNSVTPSGPVSSPPVVGGGGTRAPAAPRAAVPPAGNRNQPPAGNVPPARNGNGAQPQPQGRPANADLQAAGRALLAPNARGAVTITANANGTFTFQAKFSQLSDGAKAQVRQAAADLGPAARGILQQAIDADVPVTFTAAKVGNGFRVTGSDFGRGGQPPAANNQAPQPRANPNAGNGGAPGFRVSRLEGALFLGYQGTRQQGRQGIQPQANGDVKFVGTVRNIGQNSTARQILQGMTTNPALPASFRTALTQALRNPNARIGIIFNPRTNTVSAVAIGRHRQQGNFGLPAGNPPAGAANPARPGNAPAQAPRVQAAPADTRVLPGNKLAIPVPATIVRPGTTGDVTVQFTNAAGQNAGNAVQGRLVQDNGQTFLVVPNDAPATGATGFTVRGPQNGPASGVQFSGSVNPGQQPGVLRFDTDGAGPATLVADNNAIQLPGASAAALGGPGAALNMQILLVDGSVVNAQAVMGQNNTVQVDPASMPMVDPGDVAVMNIQTQDGGAGVMLTSRPPLDSVQLSAPRVDVQTALAGVVNPAATGRLIVQPQQDGSIKITGTAAQLSQGLRDQVGAQAAAGGPRSAAGQANSGAVVTFTVVPGAAGTDLAISDIATGAPPTVGADINRLVNTNGAGLAVVVQNDNNLVTVTAPTNQLTPAGRAQAAAAGIALPANANVTLTIDTSVRAQPVVLTADGRRPQAPGQPVAQPQGARPPAPVNPLGGRNVAQVNPSLPGATQVGLRSLVPNLFQGRLGNNPPAALLNANNVAGNFLAALQGVRTDNDYRRAVGTPNSAYHQAILLLRQNGFNELGNSRATFVQLGIGQQTNIAQLQQAWTLLNELRGRN